MLKKDAVNGASDSELKAAANKPKFEPWNNSAFHQGLGGQASLSGAAWISHQLPKAPLN